MLTNWATIGHEGRERYRNYLGGAHLRWSRNKRCERAAKQLLEPDEPLDESVDGD
jgi:hypothetical protein